MRGALRGLMVTGVSGRKVGFAPQRVASGERRCSLRLGDDVVRWNFPDEPEKATLAEQGRREVGRVLPSRLGQWHGVAGQHRS